MSYSFVSILLRLTGSSFLAGGIDYKTQVTYDDAYILSLPGFIWTKAPDSPAGKRTRHTCVSVGPRQVLSIGGARIGVTDKDLAAQGLLLFDVTEMKWQDSYDANALAYQRAPAINAWYNNGLVWPLPYTTDSHANKRSSLDRVEWTSDEVRRLLLTAPSTGMSGSPLAGPNARINSKIPKTHCRRHLRRRAVRTQSAESPQSPEELLEALRG